MIEIQKYESFSLADLVSRWEDFAKTNPDYANGNTVLIISRNIVDLIIEDDSYKKLLLAYNVRTLARILYKLDVPQPIILAHPNVLEFQEPRRGELYEI